MPYWNPTKVRTDEHLCFRASASANAGNWISNSRTTHEMHKTREIIAVDSANALGAHTQIYGKIIKCWLMFATNFVVANVGRVLRWAVRAASKWMQHIRQNRKPSSTAFLSQIHIYLCRKPNITTHCQLSISPRRIQVSSQLYSVVPK